MTDSDLLVHILETLDGRQHILAELDRYYHGTQPLSFLSPQAKIALGNRMFRIVSNIPRLAVGVLAERLRVNSFTGAEGAWDLWLGNQLDELSSIAHREALTLGSSYVICWADPDGSPRASIESAKQVAILADPGTRIPYAAVKRWSTVTTCESTLFLPDRVERWSANNPGPQMAGFQLVEVLDNPLGLVPVIQLRNGDRLPVGGPAYPDRLLEWGHSEVSDLTTLVDALCKLLGDMMVAAEVAARPRRWVAGLSLSEQPRLDEDGNPVLDGDGQPIVDVVNPLNEEDVRMYVAQDPNTKFGQLPEANLGSFQAGVDILLSQIQAVSALPANEIGIQTNAPPSADALRASENSLVARAEARQLVFGRAWEQVLNLLIAIRDGTTPTNSVQVRWAPADTRNKAQEADAVMKLVQSNILPVTYALQELGYDSDEIATIQQLRREDAQISSDTALGKYFNGLNTGK